MKFLSKNYSSGNSDGAANGRSIVDFFEGAVDTYRDLTALDADGRKVSYLELDRRANHISAYVLAHCPDPSPVALMFQDNLLSVSGIFGVLKAGKAFVFLNPAYPPERIASILEDVKPSLILTETRYLETLSALRPSLPFEDISGFDFFDEIGRPAIQISPDSPAYIIYTSGSTGVPKGCLFTHRMVLHDNAYVTSDAGITPVDRFGMLTALSFVASRAGLYGALLNGAALCMHDLSTSDPGQIVKWLDEARISILYTTPSLFRNIFLAAPSGHVFQFLRTVHLAGERVTAAEVDLFRKHTRHDAFLLVVYGQTETGRVARFPIHRDTTWNSANVPVGYLLPGKEVIILGEDGLPVKVGEVGDIVVRSAYISRGYFGTTGVDRQGFVADPDDPNLQLFHTGDIGRQMDDDVLVYLGRKDSQVKINGQRMELGEVEAALLTQPDVQTAVVVMRPTERRAGQAALIAYVVAKPGSFVTKQHLREQLSRLLPAYMIPSHFVFIPKLPLSLHGKIDVRSLPDPYLDNRLELDEADLPMDEVEKRLVEVWKRVLKFEMVGVNDSFFELGGDSLLAMQLLMEIEKDFLIRVPLTIISKASNIRQQAEILRSGNVASHASALIPIRPGGSRPPLFCISGKGGNPVRFHRLVRYLAEDQPVYFIRSRGFEMGEKIQTTIEDIAADYLREVEEIQPNGPYFFIGESGGGLVAYEMASQLQSRGKTTSLVAMLDTYLIEMQEFQARLSSSWRLIAKKHLQTLIHGGMGNLLRYYVSLWKFKYFEWKDARRVKQLRAQGGIPDVYDRIERANVTAAMLYQPKPYPGRVLLFSATRQAQIQGNPRDHGWKDVDIAEFILQSVDCFHGNILFEPFVQQVADGVNRYLNGSFEPPM